MNCLSMSWLLVKPTFKASSGTMGSTKADASLQ